MLFILKKFKTRLCLLKQKLHPYKCKIIIRQFYFAFHTRNEKGETEAYKTKNNSSYSKKRQVLVLDCCNRNNFLRVFHFQ